ncbi:hypothetical protein HPB49_008649 [Dermacentor silvarum]|uniref:Uncharacterized protein n=1 Tax=Dermacentor silvarum TaxID=543639 RepID=A0ACB8D3Z2_DERSI|nr:hypothetical protein HPB49_008649 [Dermacentor silvarum]
MRNPYETCRAASGKSAGSWGDRSYPAPPPLAAETPAGQPLNMALLEQRGYDPTTLSWSSIPANQPEDGPPNISAEQAVIFQVVESRRRRRQNARGAATSKTPLNNSAKGDAPAPSSSSKAPQKTSSPVSKWTPKPTNPEVVQKLLTDFQLNTSKGPLPLHGHLKLTGDVCRGVISVHNLETSESLKHSVQWRGGELVHVRKLGNSNVAVLTFEGRNVPRYVHYNAELTPVREYKKTVPACYCCGTLGHRADNCPNPVNERCGLCGQNVGAGTEGMAPHECNPMCIVCEGPHLTGSRECTRKFIRLQQPGPRTSGTPATSRRQPAGKAPITPPKGANPGATRESHATGRQQVNQETPSRGVTSPPDKTAAATPLPGEAEFPALSAPSGGAARNQPKVGSWARTQELRRELALLRVQNEKLASELNSLRTQFESRVAALETQVTAIETQLADLPKIIHDTIARQMDSVITQGPSGMITASKFNRVIPDESDFSEDSCTSAPGTSGLGSVNVTPPSWNCRGLKDRKKRAHLRLYLETLEFLVAVVALQEPGAGGVTLPTTPPFSYTMVSVLPLKRSDPPVHILNIYCPPKLKSVTFSEIFTQAMQVAGRDPLLIVGDFNAPSRLWGYPGRTGVGGSLRNFFPYLDSPSTLTPPTQHMSGRNTWRLFHALIDPTQTRTETQRHLHRVMHNFTGTTTQLAHTLRDRYLCTTKDPRTTAYSPSASDGGLSGVMIGYRAHRTTFDAGDEQHETLMERAQTLLHLGLSPVPEAAAQGALWIVALNKGLPDDP